MKQSILILLFLVPLISISKSSPTTNGVKALREQHRTMASPDIPGNLVINMGFNLLSNKASTMDTQFWGSKSLGLYYTFSLNNEGSSFSFNTGIGVGLEKFALKDNIVVNERTDPTLGHIAFIETLDDDIDVKQSKLAANYLEIPVELRFYSNKESREKGVYVALGASAGVLYQSHTKLKTKQDGINYKVKNRTDFELNPFRFTAIARFGFAGFSFYYRLGLSELFNSGNGPEAAPAKFSSFGISFVGL